MTVMADSLPDDPGTLKAMLIAERVQNERLRQIIKELQRHRFGRRAETLPEDQMLLGLEDVEQVAASGEAASDAANPTERASRAAKRRVNRGSLPAHLPRIEMVVDIEDRSCPCCGKALHRIGEDTGERLDIVPAQFRVLIVRRPKYACRACENVVVQAPAPARLIEGGLPTEATVAQILVSKYADHLPLYRQAQIYARQGVELDRSTLADWVGRAAFMLRPVHQRLLTARGGGGGAEKGREGEGGGGDRGGGGGVRASEGGGVKGVGRGGEVFCPCRRALIAAAGPAPIASGALERIAGLYAEKDIRGRSADQRHAVRQDRSRPIIDELEPWLLAKLALISQKTKLAEAIRYALSRWTGLTRFLDDGRVEIDSNVVERSIRPITLNRKNALFAGSDGGGDHWAVIASLIETCKLTGVDPLAYLTDVITRIVSGHPNSRIDELLPWAYLVDQPIKDVA